jgi:uncharacterized protein
MLEVYSLFDSLLAACSTGFLTGQPLVLALLLAGLIAGFTHCAAQCGAFLLARAETTAGAQVAFHAGRLLTYAALGGASAGFSRLVFSGPLELAITASLMASAGLLFLFEGVLRLPVTARLGLADWRLANRFSQPRAPVLAGAAFGLMPCGITIAALLAAATAPTAVAGALAMIAFGLGTLPGLLLISGLGRQAALRWPAVLRPLTTAALLGSGFYLFILATSVIA